VSQKAIEILLGKLISDECFLRLFKANRQRAMAEFLPFGLAFSSVEQEVLLSLDLAPFEELSKSLDIRISRIGPGKDEDGAP
jgi:hypothetical protein